MNETYVAFLRGINVGGHHKVPMQELRDRLPELGFANIQTILNTGNIIFDAGASICIGLILAGTAAWLAYEAKGLLIGESASPETVAAINGIVTADDRVLAVNELITLHMGPSDIIVTLSVDFVDGIDSSVLEGAVTELNRSIKALDPNIRRVFIEAERTGDHLPSVAVTPPDTTTG